MAKVSNMSRANLFSFLFFKSLLAKIEPTKPRPGEIKFKKEKRRKIRSLLISIDRAPKRSLQVEIRPHFLRR